MHLPPVGVRRFRLLKQDLDHGHVYSYSQGKANMGLTIKPYTRATAVALLVASGFYLCYAHT